MSNELASDRRSFLGFMALAPAALYLGGCASASGDATASEGDDVAEAELGDGGVCRRTTSDAEGPYFEEGAPVKTQIASASELGDRLFVEGRVFAPGCRTALAGCVIDVWQANKRGQYASSRLRGKVVTGTDGRYAFETIVPGRYAENGQYRPAHLHLKVSTPSGRQLLVTQLYFDGDPWLGSADFCTRSRTCNSGDPDRILKLAQSSDGGRSAQRARFDIRL
jgi:protocatechuate 3,4-dioxygenase beta subunit